MIWPFKAKQPPRPGRGLLRGENPEQVQKSLAVADVVIRAYTAVLAKKDRAYLLSERELPYSKSVIRDCLHIDALQNAGDQQYLELLKVNFLLLATFRPADELKDVFWVDETTSLADLDDTKKVGLQKAQEALKESQSEQRTLEAWWQLAVEEPIAAAKPRASN